MKKKTFDCIEMQRNIRDELFKEANYDLHTLITQIKENNEKSVYFKELKHKSASINANK